MRAMTSAVLRFTSCQAPAAELFCRGVAEYAGMRLGIRAEFIDDIPWQDRLREFDAGRIHVCWMCGLPYSWRSDRPEPALELLAAPVAAGARYGDQPVYFSDVVVRRDASWSCFGELGGATWAYNEETSHSGYNMTRHHLAQMGRRRGFFARALATGSHEASLRLLLAGRVDASAIDSTVLDLLFREDSSLAGALRIVESLGPSPRPPWVIGRALPATLRAAIRDCLLTMSDDPGGQAVLASGMASRFALVSDTDYDPIRRMARECETVVLQ